MEKLNKAAGPARKLSDDQRKRIAEIDSAYEAKRAEQRMAYEQKMAALGPGEREAMQQELAKQLADLDEKCEREKEVVWNEDRASGDG